MCSCNMYCRVRRALIGAAFFATAGCFAISADAQSGSAIRDSYTNKAPFSERKNSRANKSDSGLTISGMKSGKIIETKDRIIIDGAVFIGNETDIQFRTSRDEHRQVIINNSQFFSDGAKQPVVDVSTGSTVLLRNTRIRSRDAKVDDEDCAGVVCVRARSVEADDVQVNTSGNTQLTNR